MHIPRRVEPAVRESRIADASVPHELAEMRFDAGSLREAHQVRDNGHAAILFIATRRERCVMRWWAV